MIQTSDIEAKYDSSLLLLSPLVIKNVKDRTEEGAIIESKELQFQVTTINGQTVTGIDVDVNYYDNNGNFIGTDSDLRIENLKNNEKHTFSLFIDEPETTHRAELVINTRKYGLHEKITRVFYNPYIIAVLFGYIIYVEFIK